jgi:hypothetical protein
VARLRAEARGAQAAETPVLTCGIRTLHPVTGKPDTGLHPLGYAFDVRTVEPTTRLPLLSPGTARVLQKDLRDAGYQCVWSTHGTGPHLHVEANNDTDPVVARALRKHRIRIRSQHA